MTHLITDVSKSQSVKPTAGQLQVWIAQKLLPKEPIFNLAVSLTIRGKIQQNHFRNAFQTLINSSDVLRCVVQETADVPTLLVLPAFEYSLPYLDFSDAPDPIAAATGWTQEKCAESFDLKFRLFDSALIKLGATEFVWYLNLHHLIADAGSIQIIYQRMAQLYAFAVAGTLPHKINLNSYSDYALSQVQDRSSSRYEKADTYWKQKLSVRLESLRIYGVVGIKSGTRVSRKSWELSPSRSNRLREVACAVDKKSVGEDTLLLNAFHAVLCIYLSRIHGNDDFFVGLVSHNRRRPLAKQTIGLFSEVLPVRVLISDGDSFSSLLKKIHAEIFETMRYGNFAVDNPIHEQVYDVVLNYQKAAFCDFGGMAAKPEWIHTGYGFESFGLQIQDFGSSGTLVLNFDFHEDVFSSQQAEAAIRHFLVVLDAVVSHPTTSIRDLEIVDSDDRQVLLAGCNNTKKPFPNRPVHTLFEATVERMPNAVALISESAELTYAELNHRANQLARYVETFDISRDAPIGIYIERSIEMIVATFAVLKSGRAYVPIDPSSLPDRVAFILKDTGLSVLLTQSALLEILPQGGSKVICLDSENDKISDESGENLGRAISPDDLAYLIYTSGSTGDPKGVEVTQDALGNFCDWAGNEYQLRPGDKILQFAAISFDAAVEEIFSTLICGATLVLRTDSSIASIDTFLGKCRDWNISVLDLPTSYWHDLVGYLFHQRRSVPDSIRLVIIGGEKVSPERLEQWQCVVNGSCRLLNTYGPTEATVVATSCDLTDALRAEGSKEPVSIGRPISNVRTYVLDRQMNLVLVGVAGELCIGGQGLARGYRNNPALTSEKFVYKDFASGLRERLYRTGDWVRYRYDGQLEFLGRLDDQCKIMGYRVEPGEIEKAIVFYPGIQETFVMGVDSPSDGSRLIAYVVPKQGIDLAVADLFAFLARRLPPYMIPSSILTVGNFPRHVNGKIDRKALPIPDKTLSAPDSASVTSRTPTEETLMDIWKEVLNVSEIKIYDSFFQLGGHSLNATQVMSRIRERFAVDLPLRAIFDTPTISGLANQIQLTLQNFLGAVERPPVTPVSRDKDLPLSYSQTRMWFMHRLAPESAAYNLGGALHLTGDLNTQAFTDSINEILRRHEAIRTVFRIIDGQPRQVVTPWHPLIVREVDIRNLPQDQRPQAARQIVSQEVRRPFDLERDLLLRVLLVQLADDEHVVSLTMHHIASDQWSMGIIARELTYLYSSFCTGSTANLNPLNLQYGDFAVWQRQWLNTEVLQRQMLDWKERLAGLQPLQLPTDKPRPTVQTFNGSYVSCDLTRSLVEELKKLSAEHSATLYMTFLTAFKVLLARYSSQKDIAIGSPIANRNWLSLENIVGTFVNTLVLRTDLSGDPSFRDVLERVRVVTIDAFARQETPFEKLVEELHPDRDPSRSPLVQILFNFQNAPLGDITLHGISWRPFECDAGVSQFDLCLAVDPNVLNKLIFIYNTDLFSKSRIDRMLDHYVRILNAMVANPEAKIAQVSFQTEAEKTLLAKASVGRQSDTSSIRCVHELVEAQAKRTPDSIAVIFEEDKATYRELNERANQLAQHLEGLGVGLETLVGIFMERSVDMVVGMLAILKAGAAYVPLDPDYPEKRIAMMLEDSEARIILTQERLLTALLESKARVLCVDRDWPSIARQSTKAPKLSLTPENLAYVIFTSGSTGRPKGVEISHQALVNFLNSMAKEPGIEGDDVLLSVTPLSFDICGLEIFLPLTVGARIVLLPRTIATDGRLLRDRLDDGQVTIMQATPATWRMLIDAGWQGDKRLKILCGGEALPSELARQLLGRCASLWNMYGPTETTIWSTLYRVQSGENSVPIGHPIENTEVYILDSNLQWVPIGVPGDLYIGGLGLARGYLKMPELTKEKFISNPFREEAGSRLYKTGDMARYLPDGNIECLGRIDSQVKVRGFRIELDEVESALAQHPGVNQVIVVVREDSPSDKRLVAYVVSSQRPWPPIGELREYLHQKLPDYMVPSAYVYLESLPLTPNGKIDRLNLPLPPRTAVEFSRAFVKPRKDLEEKIAQIWAEVLNLDQVGVGDNFFDLGGHSLLTVQVISRINSDLAANLSIRSLFESPTIAQLARAVEMAKAGFIESEDVGARSPYVAKLRQGQTDKNLFSFLTYAGFLGEYGPNILKLASAMGNENSVYVLLARGIDGTSPFCSTVNQLATEYIEEIQKIQAHGPYYLIGDCYNGAVGAYETAQQLVARGEKVEFLAFLDAPYSEQLPSYRLWYRLTARARFWLWIERFYHWNQIEQITGGLMRRINRIKAANPWVDPIGKLFSLIRLPGGSSLPRSWDTSSPEDTKLTRKRTRYMLRGARNYFLAMSRYRLKPYPGRITLFINEQWYKVGHARSWAKFHERELDVCQLPGDHSTCMELGSHIVAQQIRDSIIPTQLRTIAQQRCNFRR